MTARGSPPDESNGTDLVTRGEQATATASATAAAADEAGRADVIAGTRGVTSTPARARIWNRLRIVSPALQGLLALAIYLAAWLMADALPLVAHPGQPLLAQQSPDPNFYVWCLRWWPYVVAHAVSPLHTAIVGAPAGIDLAWVTSIPPLALLTAPLTAVAGPVVTFNLLVAASLPVSAWAAFVLCRRITGRFWAALAGGTVYGFSGYEINHIIAGQLNLSFSLLLPLMAYLVVLWWDHAIGRWTFVFLLGAAIALQCYLFLETFADLTAVWVMALAVSLAVAGRGHRRAVVRLAVLVGLAYLLALGLAAPYLGFALAHIPRGVSLPSAKSAVDLSSMVVPRPGRTFGLGWLSGLAMRTIAPSRDGFVGIPLLALAVALAVGSWSSRLVRLLVIMFAAIVLLALGPTVKAGGHQLFSFPWHQLWNTPIARHAFPARFMVFADLALALVVAIWLARPARRAWLTSARWLLALLAVAAIAANVPPLRIWTGPAQPAFVTTGEYQRFLRPGETVIVASERGNAGLLWQAETNFYTRLAGGYVNEALARRNTDLPLAMYSLQARVPSPQAVAAFGAFLTHARVGAILVEERLPDGWPHILAGLGLHGKAAGGVILYRPGLNGWHVRVPRHRPAR